MVEPMLGLLRIMSCLAVVSLTACASDDGRADEGPSDTGVPTSSTMGSVGSTGPIGSTGETGGDVTHGESSSTSSESSTSATSEPTDDGGPSGIVPEFALADVNPTSATFEQAVSPRDYLEKTSGWYFTHAT
jgi:hypothetical protein